MVFCLLQTAQQKTLTGTVTSSEDNLPVIGATVLIKGTTTGVLTDVDGIYRISASEGATIEFRYVGMKTKEIWSEQQVFTMLFLSMNRLDWMKL